MPPEPFTLTSEHERYLRAFDRVLERGHRGNARLCFALDALARVVEHPRYAAMEARSSERASRAA